MTKRSILLGVIAAAGIAIGSGWAVNTVVDQSSVALPRVLIVGSIACESWERVLEGARAAAKEFGVDLQAQEPTPGQTAEQQSELVGKIHKRDFDGVAISFANPTAQLDLLNELAGRTKLVTWGKTTENSRQLCHVGFSQINAGAKAAWAARQEVTHEGQIALVTSVSGEQDETTQQRLASFKEHWAEICDNASGYPFVSVSVSAGEDFSKRLADPKLAVIVAFDTDAADAVLKATAGPSQSVHVPIIALDASDTVLDAIEAGRVASAIYNDEYEDGYEAIRRLAAYCRTDEAGLPIPGHGKIPRAGVIVRKANVADIRRQILVASKPRGSIAEMHLSSSKIDASLLAH